MGARETRSPPPPYAQRAHAPGRLLRAAWWVCGGATVCYARARARPVGPGGIGKTRLALQSVGDQRDLFVHGVAFVPLAAVAAAERIVPAITQALGCTLYGPSEPKEQLLHYLREKQLLLVLDNVEQLLSG